MHPLLEKALKLAKQGWYVLAATILMTTQPFITTLSKNDEGGYDYLPVSTTFVVEIAKLCISLTFYLLLPANAKSHRALRGKDALLFAIFKKIVHWDQHLRIIYKKRKAPPSET